MAAKHAVDNFIRVIARRRRVIRICQKILVPPAAYHITIYSEFVDPRATDYVFAEDEPDTEWRLKLRQMLMLNLK